jgi:hypothetical protein
MNKLTVLAIILLCLSACTGTNEQGSEQSNKGQPTNVSTKQDKEPDLTNSAIAKKAKEKIIKYDEINEVIAIHNDMELIVGFNVKKIQEFNVKKIEEKVKKDLEKEFPNEIITVSHDRKILMELEKLRTEQESLSEKELKKRLQKIKSLSKEIT